MIVFLFVKMVTGTSKAVFQLQLKTMTTLSGHWKVANIVLTL
jgi:hypothetical protein